MRINSIGRFITRRRLELLLCLMSQERLLLKPCRNGRMTWIVKLCFLMELQFLLFYWQTRLVVACRTSGLAGPARDTSACAKRENDREAPSLNNPPVAPPLFSSSNRSSGKRFVLIGYLTSHDPRMFFQDVTVI